MNATHELAGDLRAIETRYAELLQELADLYQLRAQMKRAAAETAGAAVGADEAHAGEEAKDRRPALRMIAGGLSRQNDLDESVINPAHRLAAKQATRAELRLVTGGRAAS